MAQFLQRQPLGQPERMPRRPAVGEPLVEDPTSHLSLEPLETVLFSLLLSRRRSLLRRPAELEELSVERQSHLLRHLRAHRLALPLALRLGLEPMPFGLELLCGESSLIPCAQLLLGALSIGGARLLDPSQSRQLLVHPAKRPLERVVALEQLALLLQIWQPKLRCGNWRPHAPLVQQRQPGNARWLWMPRRER